MSILSVSRPLMLTGLIGFTMFMTVGCSVTSSNQPPSTTQPTIAKPSTSSQPTLTGTNSLSAELDKCGNQFYQQVQPTITAKLSQATYPLCFNGFAVMYSGIARTPVWVAEHLTRQRLTYAKNLVREDNFHEETRLPTKARSLLTDYSGSGYDRGHLAPNADMSNKAAQYDSFSLANIAPQNPTNNRKTWVKIESQTRDLTNQYGAAYVVSGVSYLTPEVKLLKNRVLIPSHFYKAIYIPSQNQAVAFLSSNDDSEQVERISLSELKQRTGIDAFPNLPTKVKTALLPAS